MGWTDFQMKFIERRKQFKNVAVIETWSEIISHILSVIGLLVGFGAIVLYARFLLKGFLKILFLKLYGTTLNMQFGRITLNWLYNYLYSVRLFYFNGMLESGLERLTILFLGAFSGVKETGYFFQARRLAGVPHQILHPYFTRMLFNTFSRNDSFQLAFRTLNKNMFILLIILTIALFLTFTIGRDVIVFIFGVKWEPVITIVYALSGVIATITPFELLKVFCQAKSENMSMFLYIGRGTQYFFFVTAALVAILLGDHYVVILSAGISAGYLLGSIVLYISLYKIQSDLKLENTKF
jgi:O-antigen/teichoic acid export membrane protein